MIHWVKLLSSHFAPNRTFSFQFIDGLGLDRRSASAGGRAFSTQQRIPSREVDEKWGPHSGMSISPNSTSIHLPSVRFRAPIMHRSPICWNGNWNTGDAHPEAIPYRVELSTDQIYDQYCSHADRRSKVQINRARWLKTAFNSDMRHSVKYKRKIEKGINEWNVN